MATSHADSSANARSPTECLTSLYATRELVNQVDDDDADALLSSHIATEDNKKRHSIHDLDNANQHQDTFDIAPETAEEDDESTADFAARLLQKRVRVWLLYRREQESVNHVEMLRRELEDAAARAIQDWLVHCRQRFAIVCCARRLHAQRIISDWADSQHRRRLALHHLRARISARRSIVWWWRRTSVALRCTQRWIAKEAAQKRRRQVTRLIIRALKQYLARRRFRRVQSATRIQRWYQDVLLHRLARAQLERLRVHRRGAIACLKIAQHIAQNRAVKQWKAFVSCHRQAQENQRQRAAAVLQRLFRVVLTAFRLLRRRDAATKVQSIVRRRIAYKELTHRRLHRRNRAATAIQRIIRGFQARKKHAAMLRLWRERFRCANCGLVEPGGVYCKYCGRRRTTFTVLGPGMLDLNATTDLKLRQMRATIPCPSNQHNDAVLPPAPPPPPPHHSHSQSPFKPGLPRRLGQPPRMIQMTLENLSEPPVLEVAIAGVTPEAFRLPVPPPPRKASIKRVTPSRPNSFHRSLTAVEFGVSLGSLSVDKTRQRAEDLARQYDHYDRQCSSAMKLHIQRLEKGGKAASR